MIILTEEDWKQLSLFNQDENDAIMQQKQKNNGFPITLQWVKENYDKYNNICFEGKLPPFQDLDFSFYNNKARVLGYVRSYKFTQRPTPYASCEYQGETYYSEGCSLHLSTQYDNTEEQYLNTLIHEMCHIYECCVEPQYMLEYCMTGKNTSDYPKGGHGTIFWQEANKMAQYGFKITEVADAEEVGQHLNNTKYPWVFITWQEGDDTAFVKWSRKNIDAFVEQFCNNKFRCTNNRLHEIYIFEYIGNDKKVGNYQVSKTLNSGFYSFSQYNKPSFMNDIKFVKKIPVEYKEDEYDVKSECINRIDDIVDYAFSRWFKKITKNVIGCDPCMNLKMKLDNLHSLSIKIHYYTKITSKFYSFDNELLISINDGTSDLGNYLEELIDECWFFHPDLNSHEGQKLRNIFANAICEAFGVEPQYSTEDEYEFEEGIRNRFNTILEKISKNYNPDKLID